MRIRIEVMYDGTGFCGWQIQPHRSSVQGELTAAAERLFGERVSIVGSGRTDAGVHAIGQTAHFDIAKDFDTAKIVRGLNFYLPPAIRVVSAAQAEDDFNARFDAKNKTYRYLIYDGAVDNPLLSNRAHRVHNLDYYAMAKAASLFVGTHDFAPLSSSGGNVKTTVRTIRDSVFFETNSLLSSPVSLSPASNLTGSPSAGACAGIDGLSADSIGVMSGKADENLPKDLFAARAGEGRLFVYSVSANGFLYNMVRKIMGVLLAVGAGHRCAHDIIHILSSGERAKEIAPPEGLYLMNVEY